MINAKDLMLGNCVYDGDKTQFPMYVQAIGEDYVYLDFEGREGDVWESTPEDLQGIPITEELLTKMGFWKIPKNHFYELQFHKDDTRKIRYAITLSLKVGIANVTEYKEPELPVEAGLHLLQPSGTARIKYLHELQNLFRCITKQELEVKL